MEPQRKKQKIKCIVYTDEELIKKQEAGKNRNTTKTEERARPRRSVDFSTAMWPNQAVEYWNFMKNLNSILFYLSFGLEPGKDPDSDYESDRGWSMKRLGIDVFSQHKAIVSDMPCQQDT